MDLKLRDSDTIVDSNEFENVMKAMHSIARPIAKAHYEDESLEASVLKKIVIQATRPSTSIITAKDLESLQNLPLLTNKQKRYMDGKRVCDTLFEEGWERKVQQDPDAVIALKNDEVRETIKASQPKISITFQYPLDLEHSGSRDHQRAKKKRFENRYIEILDRREQQSASLNGEESAATVNQAAREMGWEGFVRDRFPQQGRGISIPSQASSSTLAR